MTAAARCFSACDESPGAGISTPTGIVHLGEEVLERLRIVDECLYREALEDERLSVRGRKSGVDDDQVEIGIGRSLTSNERASRTHRGCVAVAFFRLKRTVHVDDAVAHV